MWAAPGMLLAAAAARAPCPGCCGPRVAHPGVFLQAAWSSLWQGHLSEPHLQYFLWILR